MKVHSGILTKARATCTGRAVEMSEVPSSPQAWAINAAWAISCSATCFASEPSLSGDDGCGGYGLIADLAVPSLRKSLFSAEEAASAIFAGHLVGQSRSLQCPR